MLYIKKRIRAIIFDMDGTIIKSDRVYDESVVALLKDKGVTDIPREKLAVYQNLAGVSLKEAAKVLKDLFDLDDEVQALAEELVVAANKFIGTNINFVAGFEFFHEQLRLNGISSAIATNSHPVNLKKIDESINLKKFFGEHMYCVGDVNYLAKPDPALFKHAAEKLGVKPEECVVFEDSAPGFNAAKAAGMKCIAIKHEHNQNFLDLVHHAISDYQEAIDALEKILK